MKQLSDTVLRIIDLKKANHLTTKDLSHLSDVSVGTLNKILCGERPNIGVPILTKIAVALNTSLDYLVFGNEASTTRTATSQETQLLVLYRQLNAEDQKLLLNYANTLILAAEAASAISQSSELPA